jgi:hypothetical protein
VAVGNPVPGLTMMGFIAAFLQVATPAGEVIDASIVSETVHLGAANGGSGHPFGMLMSREYV